MLARISLLILATALLAGYTAISTGIQYVIIRPFISDPKPLHQAAQSGDAEAAQKLIADGAKVNTKDRAGDRPLDLAGEHRDVSNFLRQHGGITKTESNNPK